MAKIPKFHFDFGAVAGLDITDALKALMLQMEDHYNANFQAPKLVFGGSVAAEKFVSGLDMTPPPTVNDSQEIVQPEPAGPVDVNTVTPKTVQMKSFSIKDGKDLGLKEGDTILKGITDKGVAVFDKLLPGYDEQPYGPVVQGESGRYNLKRSK